MSTQKNYDVGIFKIVRKPKLTVNAECPKCHHRFIDGVSHIYLKCRCGNEFKQEVAVDTYKGYMPWIFQKLSNHNEVHIITPVNNYYLDFLNAVRMYCMKIGEVYERIQEPVVKVDKKVKKVCKSCGYCMDCIQCKKCGNVITMNYAVKCRKCNIVMNRIQYNKLQCPSCGKTKNMKCPKCKSKDFSQHYISKLENNVYHKYMCQSCNGTNIKGTTFDTKECPMCKSINFVDNSKMYILIIKRLKKHMLENINRGV